MPCTHIKQLYQLVEQHDMKLASSDLIRIVCPHCGLEETCPDRLMEDIGAHDQPSASETASEGAPPTDPRRS